MAAPTISLVGGAAAVAPPKSLALHFQSLSHLQVSNLSLTLQPRRRCKRTTPHRSWRISAAGDVPAAETAQQAAEASAITANGDPGSTVISALFLAAFIGLSILTVGVIYLGVTDFLQKREREKFEKEEAAKKKSGRKKKVMTRAGPRGFGQKMVEIEDD